MKNDLDLLVANCFICILLLIVWLISVPSSIIKNIDVLNSSSNYRSVNFYIDHIKRGDSGGSTGNSYLVYGNVESKDTLLGIYNYNDVLEYHQEYKKNKNKSDEFTGVDDFLEKREEVISVFYCKDVLPIFFNKENEAKLSFKKYIMPYLLKMIAFELIFTTVLFFAFISLLRRVRKILKLKEGRYVDESHEIKEQYKRVFSKKME